MVIFIFMIIIFTQILRRVKPHRRLLNLVQSIYGIGKSRSKYIIVKLAGRFDLPISKFWYKHYYIYDRIINKYCLVLLTTLKYLRIRNRSRLKKIHCYRGIRLIYYLPSHGQRTKSNAITARYLGSGTFEYVPRKPGNFRKILSYVRRTPLIKKKSEEIYLKRLKRNFLLYQVSDSKSLTYAHKRGQLGVFRRFIPKLKKLVKKKISKKK